MTTPLSVLDLSPVSAGSTPQQAIRNTIELAQHAERWGYRRFWVAEHHFVSVASAAPTTLIALIAAATSTIRIGTAAVQLGHHTSASVVEAFGTVDAVYPGRVDLGVGRSGHRKAQLDTAKPAPRPQQQERTVDGVVVPVPFVPSQIPDTSHLAATLTALQQPGARSQDFGEQVDEIRSLLDGTYTADGVALHAVPGEAADIELWLFGSSGGESAQLAGRLGLPFVASYHVAPGTILETVQAYREAFQPSQRYPEPYLVVSADVVVAADDATAQHRASTYGHWVYSIRSGSGAAEYADPDTAPPLPDEHLPFVADRLSTQFVGSPETVVKRLAALRDLTRADELLVTSVTFRHEDRLESHRLLAEGWQHRQE